MSSRIDDSAFKQAVEKFRSKLTPEQAQDFQLTTIDDLKSAIAKLQNQQMSERKLRNPKRLESFVLASLSKLSLSTSTHPYLWVSFG
jgi:hypothetical protein